MKLERRERNRVNRQLHVASLHVARRRSLRASEKTQEFIFALTLRTPADLAISDDIKNIHSPVTRTNTRALHFFSDVDSVKKR